MCVVAFQQAEQIQKARDIPYTVQVDFTEQLIRLARMLSEACIPAQTCQLRKGNFTAGVHGLSSGHDEGSLRVAGCKPRIHYLEAIPV